MRLLNFIILGIIFLWPSTYAAQEAVVRSQYAVLFADPDLKAPIGKISQGQTLMVGANPRRGGTIYSTAVSGHLAWVKAEEIALKSDQDYVLGRYETQFTEHNLDEQFRTTYERLTENNYLIFGHAQFQMSREWDIFVRDIGYPGEVQSKSQQYRFFIDHRYPRSSYNWGAGLFYLQSPAHLGQAQVRGIYLEGKLGRRLLQLRPLQLELAISLLASPNAEIGLNTVDVFHFKKGPSWGYRAGLNALILPYSKIGGVIGLHYEWIDAQIFKNIPGREQTFKLRPLHGTSLQIGLTYKI